MGGSMYNFYALVIMQDLSLKKWWTNNKKIAATLKERKDIKVYNQSKDQEALLQEDGSLLWRDVPAGDSL
jgi:hypothetical protein